VITRIHVQIVDADVDHEHEQALRAAGHRDVLALGDPRAVVAEPDLGRAAGTVW